MKFVLSKFSAHSQLGSGRVVAELLKRCGRQVRLPFLSVLMLSILIPGTVTGQVWSDQVVRGVVRAEREATLTAEIPARIEAVGVRIGDSFEKGDKLIEFDCRIIKADADAASSAYRASLTRYNNQLELQKLQAAGKLEVQIAKAEYQEARAVLNAAKARQQECRLVAPFSGRVADISINAYEQPGSGQPLMKIVSTKAHAIHLIVPSEWLSVLRTGDKFEFFVDETQEPYEAHVSRIAAEVDAVSRTVKVVAKFAEDQPAILPGMSGSAHFNLGKTKN